MTDQLHPAQLRASAALWTLCTSMDALVDRYDEDTAPSGSSAPPASSR
ncbi:hypothetical protein FB565_001644 [Actinoplanes lutulentus]|nr:hypothetical protein [Actinoplanes lutulentus]MBB2941940.1 hypothetical protein [Actinoplanes lutulentus]